jgi:hypothetical protein
MNVVPDLERKDIKRHLYILLVSKKIRKMVCSCVTIFNFIVQFLTTYTMASGFFALLDDIAALMDDVVVLSK